jgi:signal transduction histidine kinase
MALAGLVQRLKAAVQTLGRRLTSRRAKPIDAARFDAVLGMLERDARLKGEILDEIREATRVGEGAPLRRSSHVDLAELVRSTAETLVPLAQQRDIVLHARCAATSVVISADPEDLTHVVGRVLACAIASSERGGTVDCHLSLDADWVRLVVHVHRGRVDVGSVPRVLESSRERPSERDAAEWELLGLGTVRMLVELYGGFVRVERQGPPSHWVFTVSLPGDRAVRGPAAPEKSPFGRDGS